MTSTKKLWHNLSGQLAKELRTMKRTPKDKPVPGFIAGPITVIHPGSSFRLVDEPTIRPAKQPAKRKRTPKRSA